MSFGCKTKWLILFACLAFCACTEPAKLPRTGFNDPFFATPKNTEAKESEAEEAERIKIVFAGIDERNSSAKRNTEWIRKSYQKLGSRKLNDLSAGEFARYRQFVNKGEAFVIVHPGFFAFFDTLPMPVPPAARNSDGFPIHNVVERLSAGIPADATNLKVMREQERLIRDFLEFAAVEKQLVILLLPRDYRKNLRYVSEKGDDEYARYLNDLTNMAESAVYIESETYDTGYLDKHDVDLLRSFFKETGVETVLFGGGYVGRCIDAFYSSVVDIAGYNNTFFVPELAALAPGEVGHEELMRQDEKINFTWVIKYFNEYASQTGKQPKVRRLNRYEVYANR